MNKQELDLLLGADTSDRMYFFVPAPQEMAYYLVYQDDGNNMIAPYNEAKPVKIRFFVERFPFWSAEFDNFSALANAWEKIVQSNNPLELIKKENLAKIIDDIEPDYNPTVCHS